MLWCTGFAAVLLALFPNGMGSNFERLPWICLPAAVGGHRVGGPQVAARGGAARAGDGRERRRRWISSTPTQPAASAAYYAPLITQLNGVSGPSNYRLEVVQNPRIHTAAYALLGHAALAGRPTRRRRRTH